jgi:hypothetical protein
MPAPDVSSVSPRYRIKSAAEIYERIVAESELRLPNGGPEGAQLEPEDMDIPELKPDGVLNKQRD